MYEVPKPRILLPFDDDLQDWFDQGYAALCAYLGQVPSIPRLAN